MCNCNIEDVWHIFFACPFAQDCYRECNILSIVDGFATGSDSFAELVFKVLEQAVYTALDSLYDWLRVAQLRSSKFVATAVGCPAWHCPPPGFLKCNVDAGLDGDSNCAGMVLVIRNADGEVVASRMLVCRGVPSVKEAEVFGVLQALNWIRELQFHSVLIEIDAKVVVDAIYGAGIDVSEFGVLVAQCKQILSLQQDYSIRFVHQQANVVAHALVREARYHARLINSFDVPISIKSLLNVMCKDLNL
ncbi:hypothetical protein PTKIN_Ptkin14bG0055900 [Pterospermum kingtungense]